MKRVDVAIRISARKSKSSRAPKAALNRAWAWAQCAHASVSRSNAISEVQFFAPAVAYPLSDGDEAISRQRKNVRPSVVESIINASARPLMVNAPRSLQLSEDRELHYPQAPRGPD
jgi:hypothetical protein